MTTDMGNGSKKEAIQKRILVAVAAHKDYRMPADSVYLPVFVGAALHPEGAEAATARGWQRDDDGADEISRKNPGYCELTALYWLWKNTKADYMGLVHYRRHFAGSGRGKDPFSAVLGEEELSELLREADLILPKKRRYLVETLYSHYAMTHYAKHLDLTRAEIADRCPEDLPAFDRAVKKSSGYMFNMLIARADLADAYLSWLFPILDGLSERLKGDEETDALSAYQGRLYGRVSEILLNVWLEKMLAEGSISPERIREQPYINMEGSRLPQKAWAFLKAKFFRKKYTGSF